MKLHLACLPHTETTSEFVTCAYTMKAVKFAKMMTDAGVDVIVYSGEENEAVCAEHVPVFSREERERWFGVHDQNGLWGNVTWDAASEPWLTVNARTAGAVCERAEEGDLLLLIAGLSQRPLAESVHALAGMTACEWAVGYKGIYTGFCAFESHAWRHHVYGLNGIEDGRFYDTVIPNFFDPDDFSNAGVKDDYLLFVGRLIGRKGPHVAAQIAKAAGRKLIVAGPGGTIDGPHRIVGLDCVIEGDVEYVGPVGAAERAHLMAHAAALIVPTLYIEPFGGVAVEAMLSGTPAVTTPWGAFSETVSPGVGGYTFSTLAEAVEAVEAAQALDPHEVEEYALSRFSLEAVAPQFQRWFRQLDGLRGEGWYTLPAKVA